MTAAGTIRTRLEYYQARQKFKKGKAQIANDDCWGRKRVFSGSKRLPVLPTTVSKPYT